MPPEEVLRIDGVTKRFGETIALDAVGFAVRRGAIHGLLGTNGSGKSTLIKVLAGVHPADAGTIEVSGRRHAATSMTPGLAAAANLRFVHQSTSVVPDLTVAENLALGQAFPRGVAGRIRWSVLHDRALGVLERFGIDAEPRQPVGTLRPAVRTMVAIARALQDVDADAGAVLVLDEPTAALPRHEVEHLLDALRAYAAAGVAIVIVTHRIDEALAVCDTVTVLRDGTHVETRDTAGLTETTLIRALVGRPLENVFPDRRPENVRDEVALEVRDVVGAPLRGVDLDVRRGEIVGLAGLLGSGRSELLQTIFAARDPGPGRVRIDGAPTDLRRPADAMQAGVAYVPEDRAQAAAFLDLAITDNLTIARLERYAGALRLDRRRERADVGAALQRYRIKAPSGATRMGALSGGNQQKVILARWLERAPRVLLLDEPTQGVDVGARTEIYRLVRAAADDGCAVLLASSDLDELLHLSDRILTLVGGRIQHEVRAVDIDHHQLTEMTYGAQEAAR